MRSKALVTGATGFIGAQLVRRLVEMDWTVTALVRDGSGAAAIESPSVEIVRGDIRSPSDLERATRGCDRVFHLAVDRGSRDVIVSGAANVADAAARSGVERIVFTSSAGVYRQVRQSRVSEDTPIRPDPGYHSFQAEAEDILLHRWSDGGSPVVIARICSLGPAGPTWLGVYRAIASGRFRMVGHGRNHYQPMDVSDLVEGLVRCGTVAGVDGRIYILAGASSYELRQIVHVIEKELGMNTSGSLIPLPAVRIYKWLGDRLFAWTGKELPRRDRAGFFLYDRSFDLSRARSELGYAPKVGLEEMVRRAADSFRAQGLLPPPGAVPAGRA